MFLRSISLRQFRNHRHLQLDIDPGVNLFLGSNGAGKTNIIEAVAVLATGISPRGAEPENMVEWGQDGFAIKGEFRYEDPGFDPISLEMKYRSGLSRVIRLNGQIAVRLKDLLGRVPMVSFVPEDLSLVKGEPELRRRALNMILVQTDPAYADLLQCYTEAVRSRNAALRQLAERRISEDALEPWDESVVKYGPKICRRRAEFLDDFSIRVSSVQERVSGGREQMTLEYKPSFKGPWDDMAQPRWREEMRRTRFQDAAACATLMGPHRDDVLFLLNGRPAKSFGSEGQKRTAAVAFKLAEIPYIEEKLGNKPICLLDDVLSELDAQRAEHLLNELSQIGQCFVTLTGLEAWPRNCDLPASVFHVDRSGVRAVIPAKAARRGEQSLDLLLETSLRPGSRLSPG